MDDYLVPFVEHFGSYSSAADTANSANVARLLICARAQSGAWKPIAQLGFPRTKEVVEAVHRSDKYPTYLGHDGSSPKTAPLAWACEEEDKESEKTVIPSSMLPWELAQGMPIGDLVRGTMSLIDVPPLRNDIRDLQACGMEVRHVSKVNSYSLDGNAATVISTSEALQAPIASLFSDEDTQGSFAVLFITFPENHIPSTKVERVIAGVVAQLDPPRRRCQVTGSLSGGRCHTHLVDRCLGAEVFELLMQTMSAKFAQIAASTTDEEVEKFYKAQQANVEAVFALGHCPQTNLLCVEVSFHNLLEFPLVLLLAVRLEKVTLAQESYDMVLYHCDGFSPPCHLTQVVTAKIKAIDRQQLPALLFRSSRNFLALFFGSQGLRLLDEALTPSPATLPATSNAMETTKRKERSSPEDSEDDMRKKLRSHMESTSASTDGPASETRSSGIAPASSEATSQPSTDSTQVAGDRLQDDTAAPTTPQHDLADIEAKTKASLSAFLSESSSAYYSGWPGDPAVSLMAALELFHRWVPGVKCIPAVVEEEEEDNSHAARAILLAWTGRA